MRGFLHSRALLPLIPPNPLLPQGEKGESGRPEAKNEKRNAGLPGKTQPFKDALVLWKRRTPVRHAGSSGIWSLKK
jgi:hypothetical protein